MGLAGDGTRRLGARPLLVLLAVAAVALVLLAGVGPNLPGPNVREWLGLADTRQTCSENPQLVRAPRRPPPGPGAWRREPSSPIARNEMDGVAIGDTIYYGTGFASEGGSSTAISTFDTRTGRFGRAPDMPIPLDHALLVAHGGALYLVGGFTPEGQPSDRLFTYDPSRDQRWRPLARMSVPRGAPAGAVVGDRLYVAGGAKQNADQFALPYRSVEVYDFDSDSWSAGPELPSPRHHAAGVADGRDLYVIGGRDPSDLTLSKVDRLDVRTGAWKRVTPLPFGTSGAEAEDLDGRIVVTGGEDPTLYDEGRAWVTPAAWELDPRSGRWTRLPNLHLPRHGHASAVVGGRVYVLEGIECPGGTGGTHSVESLDVGAR